jgi:hypothetical protein
MRVRWLIDGQGADTASSTESYSAGDSGAIKIHAAGESRHSQWQD